MLRSACRRARQINLRAAFVESRRAAAAVRPLLQAVCGRPPSRLGWRAIIAILAPTSRHRNGHRRGADRARRYRYVLRTCLPMTTNRRAEPLRRAIFHSCSRNDIAVPRRAAAFGSSHSNFSRFKRLKRAGVTPCRRASCFISLSNATSSASFASAATQTSSSREPRPTTSSKGMRVWPCSINTKPTAAGTLSSSKTRILCRAAPVIERGADVLLREDRVLRPDPVNRVSGVCKGLDTFYRNAGSCNHRFIRGNPAALDDLANRVRRTLAQGADSPLHIAADDLQRYLQDQLAGNIFLPIRRIIVENDAAVENIEGRFRPHIFAKMKEPLFDLAQMLERHARLIPDGVQNLEADDLAKRVHTAERGAAVIVRQRRHEKPGAVPVTQLVHRDAGQACNVLFAERGYDVMRIHAVPTVSFADLSVNREQPDAVTAPPRR